MVLRLVNDGVAGKRVYLAPWGDAYQLEAGAEIAVFAAGGYGVPRVDAGDGHITIWGWPESVLVVTRDGIPLGGDGDWQRPRVPPVPPGVDEREFLELIRPAVDDEDEEGG
jgi:hypothetical protein